MKLLIYFYIITLFLFSGCFVPQEGAEGSFPQVDIIYDDDNSCDDCGSYQYANGLLGEAWLALEADAKANLGALHLGGAECAPIKRCGTLTLADADIEFVYCQDDPTNTGLTTGTCDISTTGYFMWKAYFAPSIGSTIEFNNYEFTHDSKTFYATGTIIVSITDAGTESGSSSTQVTGGSDLVITGDYNGTIVDDVTITNSNKAGGSYEITCSDTDCHSSPVIYDVTRVDGETLLSEQSD